MQTLKIEDIEKKINKKIRQNAVSIGFDVSEAYTGVCILRTDKEYIYIENLSVIETSSKDDIKNRMKYFVGAIGKFKQGLNYKEYKIIVVEDSWMGKNVFTLKNLIRFSTLLWMLFYNECDYFYFLLPTSARSQIGFNKNKQIVVGNVSSGVYTRDTKNKQGKILHKKGEKKKIDIKLLIMDYLKQEFKVEIENSDKADAFVFGIGRIGELIAMMKLHAGHIELALANYFNFQTHLIVPNVSYGWGLNYEADLVIITPSRYAWEIEIKTSIADLKADLKKKHQHDSNKFKALYFAVPRDLKEKALELIPERAGLFVILEPGKENKWFPAVMLIKSPKINMKADKITDKELEKLYKLAAMRIWSLKEIIYKLQKE